MSQMNPVSRPEVTTTVGTFRGVRKDGVDCFLGVRYAEPPVGALRFKPPRPRAAEDGVIDASSYGNRNFQVGRIDDVYGSFVAPDSDSEDCLFLNVFLRAGSASANPQNPQPKPVLVWIHGGAFQSGSGAEYEPLDLLADSDVLVVTINYRLGIFGFLNLARYGEDYADSANLGIQDQVAALAWVRENIASFGGDPGNVTIFGESAGAASVYTLLGVPSAEGLFHKAMAFSGGETLAPGMDPIDGLKAALGETSDEACLEALKSLPADELSQLQVRSMFYPNPWLDGVTVTRPSCEAIRDGGAAHVPIIAGATIDDGTLLAPLFAPTEDIGEAMLAGLAMSIGRDDGAAYLEYLGRTLGNASIVERVSRAWFDTFRASAVRVAAAASDAGAGGWAYNFEVETEHPLGVTHFSDIPFLFRWISDDHPRLFVHPPSAVNQRLSEQWSRTLIAFARTGSPNGAGLPDWARYGAPRYLSLRVAQTSALLENPDGELLDIYRAR